MLEVPEDGCARNRLFRAIDESFRTGDFAALGRALGGAPRWFDEDMPLELGLGHPLEYAIYWSPLQFIEELIAAGSDPNYEDAAGFPGQRADARVSLQHAMLPSSCPVTGTGGAAPRRPPPASDSPTNATPYKARC